MDRILKALRGHKHPLGTFTQLKSTTAIEAMAYTGLDYVVIDTEHCPAGIDFVSSAVTAASAAGVSSLVRINEIARSAVLQSLDVGADGLIVPNVETVEQVRRLIHWAKFPPLGGRGFCPTRDGGWGYDVESRAGTLVYMARCDRQTLLLPQCETRGCLEHIEEIAALDGVDGIFVGPLDLSIALGCPMELDAPVMQEALARILAACRAAGKYTFIFAGDAKAAKGRFAEGFDSVTLGLDTMVYIDAYRTMVDDVRR